MKKINAVYVSLAALVLAVAALFMCLVCCCGKGASTGAVAKALNENPQLVVDALNNYQAQQRAEAEALALKAITDNIDEINNYEGSAVIGNPNGSVTLVEFFDYSCGYCHRLYPVLKNIIAKNPDLRVVLKELAFVNPQISSYAAKAALAANEQGKYAEMYTALFEAKGPLTEAKIDELAKVAGIDVEKMKADMNSSKISKTMADTSSLAGRINVNGVPTLIIEGKLVQTLDESEIQNAIDAAK